MSRNEKKQWSPTREAVGTSIINVFLALMLAGLAWMIAAGSLSMPRYQIVIFAVAGFTLIGLLTFMNHTNRPWLPSTRLAQNNERAKRQVERDWWKEIKVAQKLLGMLEGEFGKAVLTQDDKKTRVLSGLACQTIKSTKASLTLLQSGYPEAALCIWRTLFELRVNAGYIKDKNPEVAARFVEWAEIAQLRRLDPRSDNLKQIEEKWQGKFNVGHDDGWTGTPPLNIVGRAKDIGLDYGTYTQQTKLDMYKLANSFVHANWTSIDNALGNVDPRVTDGVAEGIGEILYIVMETAIETIAPFMQPEQQEECYAELFHLRDTIRAAPERLRGKFIRLPLAEPVAILPDGRVAISFVKRREEWPEEAESRWRQEAQDILSELAQSQEESG